MASLSELEALVHNEMYIRMALTDVGAVVIIKKPTPNHPKDAKTDQKGTREIRDWKAEMGSWENLVEIDESVTYENKKDSEIMCCNFKEIAIVYKKKMEQELQKTQVSEESTKNQTLETRFEGLSNYMVQTFEDSVFREKQQENLRVAHESTEEVSSGEEKSNVTQAGPTVVTQTVYESPGGLFPLPGVVESGDSPLRTFFAAEMGVKLKSPEKRSWKCQKCKAHCFAQIVECPNCLMVGVISTFYEMPSLTPTKENTKQAFVVNAGISLPGDCCVENCPCKIFAQHVWTKTKCKECFHSKADHGL